jgi:hypothetical protein
MAEHEPDGLLEGANTLQAAIRDNFVAKLPELTMSSVDGDLSALVARFVLERQTEALRAAVVLADKAPGAPVGTTCVRRAHLDGLSLLAGDEP